mgnify:CR=1 FL=1
MLAAHVDGLQKEGVGEGLCDQQNAFFAQRGQKLLGGCGLGQKYHTGIRFLHGVGAQLVAELIRKRRVDHDELKSDSSILRRASAALGTMIGRA